MPRTIVYRRKRGGGHYKAGQRSDGSPPDGYMERLAKLVPAEVLAFFIPAAAQWGEDDTKLVVILLIGLIATPAQQWLYARRQREDDKPLLHYYVIVTLAFAAWSLGVSGHVSGLFGMSDATGAFIVTVAAFGLPLVDSLLEEAVSD